MSEIKEILIELGYQLTDDKDGWRTNAIFRGGSNPTAIKIFSDNGRWCDFVESQRGSLNDLIKLTLGFDDNKAKDWLKGKIDIEKLYKGTIYKEKLKTPDILNKEILMDLIPSHEYWLNRGITERVCKEFCGGVCLESQTILGKMKKRYVFPIYNSNKQLIGLAGRALSKENNIKWRLLGVKNDWCYPMFLNIKIIKEKSSIILTEGIGDVLSLWTSGINNVACLFGTSCGFGLLNCLIKLNPKKIFISLNSDIAGKIAAEKLKRRFYKYFNPQQIEILYPPDGYKDFNDIFVRDGNFNKIKEWEEKLCF